jgi:hypothetical protein
MESVRLLPHNSQVLTGIEHERGAVALFFSSIPSSENSPQNNPEKSTTLAANTANAKFLSNFMF